MHRWNWVFKATVRGISKSEERVHVQMDDLHRIALAVGCCSWATRKLDLLLKPTGELHRLCSCWGIFFHMLARALALLCLESMLPVYKVQLIKWRVFRWNKEIKCNEMHINMGLWLTSNLNKPSTSPPPYRGQLVRLEGHQHFGGSIWEMVNNGYPQIGLH